MALVYRRCASINEPGDDYSDQLHPERAAHRLMSRLKKLGFDIS